VVTRTLTRGLSILETLAAADELGLGPSAIAAAVVLDKATVTRLLRTLIETGYVIQDPVTRRYRLTGKILRLAQGIARSLDLQRVARPHLKALRDRLGETVHLGVMEDLAVYYVDKLEADNSIQLVTAVGQTMPLHSTALGKAMLAALPEDEREAKYRRMDFAARTDRTICTLAEFREEIRRTQVRGYAIDDRENQPLGACVAAAIIAAGGRAAGAMSVSGPHFRVQDHLDEFGEQVRATAAQIAWELGSDPVRVGPRAVDGTGTPESGSPGAEVPDRPGSRGLNPPAANPESSRG
jgi:DNA-binding IclR family transcriptional regulator